MIENYLLWREKAKNQGFRRFLHSSMLFSTKATAMPNFRAETLLWAEILPFLLFVKKLVHPPPPLQLHYCGVQTFQPMIFILIFHY